MTPSFLQGHAGDVNPGDGVKWIGEAEQSANAVFDAIQGAMNSLKKIELSGLRDTANTFGMPLNLDLHREWLTAYKENPDACASGVWVDPGFANEWYEAMMNRTWAPALPIPISAIQLGNVGLAFQPGELFSYYGIKVRTDSPFDETLVMGYTDASIGYLTDPNAYKEGDGGIYAAVTVPKIIDVPPFSPEAGRALATGMVAALKATLA